MKRFHVTSVTRDKEYDLAKGSKPQVLYFTANPNGEAEVVTVHLRALQKLKKLRFDIDFSDLAIKGRGAGGNLVSKNSIKRIELKEGGVSTLSARKIWYDDKVMRLNVDAIGTFLGDFQADDKILVIKQDGTYQLVGFDLSSRFTDDMVIYYDGAKNRYFVKRFIIENSEKVVSFISENEKSHLEFVSTDLFPMAEVVYKKEKGKERKVENINLSEFISVKGVSAQGNKLTNNKVNEINVLNPLPEILTKQEEKEEDTNEASAEKDDNNNKSEKSKTIIIEENSTDNQFKLEL